MFGVMQSQSDIQTHICEIPRNIYAHTYGPTVGDKVYKQLMVAKNHNNVV